MGYDAIVYFNPARYDGHPLREHFEIDRETGQLYDIDGRYLLSDMGPEFAAEEYIGNAGGAGHLRAVIRTVLPDDSIILTRVLMHTAEPAIWPKSFPLIESEMSIIAASRIPSDWHIRNLLEVLERLIKAGREQDMPILIA